MRPPKGSCFRFDKRRLEELINDNRITFGPDGKNTPRLKKFLSEVKDSLSPFTVWDDAGTNQDAAKELKAFHDRSKFKTPKPEKLLKRIIEISSSDLDIILDPFAGAGTTAAVALKMKRKFITCEQMDYGKDIIINRLQKVVEGEQGGISEEVAWEGGRGFCSFELKKLNQNWIEKIEKISSIEKLKALVKDLLGHDYLSIYSDTNQLLMNIEENSIDSLEFAKEALIEILDRSQLYLSYSELEDKKHGISKEEITLNHKLYK